MPLYYTSNKMTQQNKKFTDIKAKSWFHFLPPSWHPFAYLMRLDRPIGTWLLLFPCWFSYSLTFNDQTLSLKSLMPYVYFAIGAFIMRSCGCVINDLWDKDLDKAVERTASRPLASGALTRTQAFITVIILLILGFLVLIQFNLYTIALGALGLVPVILYPLAKRVTYWPQLVLGFTFNWGALLGWTSYYEALSWKPLLLYLGCLFWTIGYDTIYAYQDKKDDEKIGIKSTALLFEHHGKLAVGLCYLLSLLCLNLAFQTFLIALPFLHMIWQIRKWDMASQASSLAIFKSNITCGALIFSAALFSLSPF